MLECLSRSNAMDQAEAVVGRVRVPGVQTRALPSCDAGRRRLAPQTCTQTRHTTLSSTLSSESLCLGVRVLVAQIGRASCRERVENSRDAAHQNKNILPKAPRRQTLPCPSKTPLSF